MSTLDSTDPSGEINPPSEHWWETVPFDLPQRREVVSILVRHGHGECAQLEVDAILANPFWVGPALLRAFDVEGV